MSKCAHCDRARGSDVWDLSICADNRKRMLKLCRTCDARLNRIVLKFFNVAGLATKMAKYTKR